MGGAGVGSSGLLDSSGRHLQKIEVVWLEGPLMSGTEGLSTRVLHFLGHKEF